MEDEGNFLKQLQELLTFGRFDSTYKLALLQALADISVENPIDPKTALVTRSSDIAEKMIKYYWNQASPFRDHHVLQQSHRDQILAIKEIRRIKKISGPSLIALRQNTELHAELCNQLAVRVRDQPLKRLQRIGDREVQFLYKPNTNGFATIELLPSAHKALSNLYELVTAAIQGKWVQHVCSIKVNRKALGPQVELHGFLFGQGRKSLTKFKAELEKLQLGICLYCGHPLDQSSQIDHFIAWSRYPLDEGFNLVLCHSQCNNAKKDHIPALVHLESWVENLNARGNAFTTKLNELKLPAGKERTLSVVGWAYSLAESSQLRLWIKGSEFEDCNHRWARLLNIL